MLLRLRSPDGMFRLTVEKDDTFGEVVTKVITGRFPRCCTRYLEANVHVYSLSHSFLQPSTQKPSPSQTIQAAAMLRRLAKLLSLRLPKLG